MINPVGTKVVIRRLKEKLASSTIILDETVAARDSQAAEVIAVGRGITLRDGTIFPLDVKAGDMVYLPPYVGSPFTEEGVDYHVVEYGDILAVGRDSA